MTVHPTAFMLICVLLKRAFNLPDSLSALRSMRIFSDLVFSNAQNPTMEGWDDNDDSVGMRSRGVQRWRQVLHLHEPSSN